MNRKGAGARVHDEATGYRTARTKAERADQRSRRKDWLREHREAWNQDPIRPISVEEEDECVRGFQAAGLARAGLKVSDSYAMRRQLVELMDEILREESK